METAQPTFWRPGYSYDPYGNPTSMTNGAGTAVSQTSNTIAAINPFRYRGIGTMGIRGCIICGVGIMIR